MHIAVLSSEVPDNACGRVRLRDIFKYLAPELTYSWTSVQEAETIGADAVTARCQAADVIVVQRAFPRTSTIDILNTVLFNSSKPVIYETDDLLTNLPIIHPEFNTYSRHRHLTLACIANCDAVIVSTEALKTHYTQYNPRVYVFPNTIDRPLWHQPLVTKRKIDVCQPLTIGFCGSHTHVPDLEATSAALERIQAKYGERVRFKFFGCITDRLRSLPGMHYCEGFVSYNDYPTLLRSLQLDIGLAPLVDNQFNACKSHIKYLEYAACGIPGIYSDIAPYKSSVTNGRTGLLVENSTQAWFEAIVQLIEQPDLLERMAAAAYEDIWARFATEARASDWLAVVRTTLQDTFSIGAETFRNRSGYGLTMWEMALDYERYLAEATAALARAQKRIDRLEQRRSLKKVLQAVKDAFTHRRYGEN